MEGPFNDSGPLKAAYDEGVWLRPLCLHQLAFWNKRPSSELLGEKILSSKHKIKRAKQNL